MSSTKSHARPARHPGAEVVVDRADEMVDALQSAIHLGAAILDSDLPARRIHCSDRPWACPA
eukprot:229448-Pyramimonas_sp.AAC.1